MVIYEEEEEEEEEDDLSWYLGLSRQQDPDEKAWLWADGSTPEFSRIPWHEGEPNNMGGKEKCTVLHRKGLLDIPCTDWANPYVCSVAAQRVANVSVDLINESTFKAEGESTGGIEHCDLQTSSG